MTNSQHPEINPPNVPGYVTTCCGVCGYKIELPPDVQLGWHYRPGKEQTAENACNGEHVEPCSTRTWCVLDLDHAGPCHEEPRKPIEPSDFGPKAAGKRRW